MTEKFTFFWDGPFSQWYPARFQLHGITFKNAEMYMMWYKDQVFSGGKLAAEILAAEHPRDAKALGKKVEGFEWGLWKVVAKQGVFVGNVAKFSQNPRLMNQLLATAGTTLVEASPEDVVWGIGFRESDPEALDRNSWRGTNWLGEVLTDVRESFLATATAERERCAQKAEDVGSEYGIRGYSEIAAAIRGGK